MLTALRPLHQDPALEAPHPAFPYRQRFSNLLLVARSAGLIRVRRLPTQQTSKLVAIKAASIRANVLPIPSAIKQLMTPFRRTVDPIRIVRFRQPLGEPLAERPIKDLLSHILGPERGTAAVQRRDIDVVQGDLEGSDDALGTQGVLAATAGNELGEGFGVQAPCAFFQEVLAVAV